MSECTVCGLTKSGFGLPYNPYAHCRCGRPLLESTAQALAREERSEAIQRVKFTLTKGFAHPAEMAEFNRLWKQWKESGTEAAKEEFEAWVTQMNARTIASLPVTVPVV